MKNKKVIVFIGIGSNLGNRQENIQKAIDLLKNNNCCELFKTSSIIETEPQGGPAQPNFLNSVIKIKTSLSARELLKTLQSIENQLGRRRTVKNGPRVLDLDILLYDDREIREPDLTIPHPRMFGRQFVLEPLLEIEPGIFNQLTVLKDKK